ncbi:hypothetical protein EDD29_4208 [Actinocorallia herbida]|uniref:DUF3298 domain-containing protein n=1 Tax=Actinocorallia herbida TaxID=58109 RepID=A0A3N1CZB6_9ACTN|nr:hypothetical protein [Actinocorallia herbida]ROO86634.1 hypothetical protein EDD29_4208 [Actinocorallia herbida]
MRPIIRIVIVTALAISLSSSCSGDEPGSTTPTPAEEITVELRTVRKRHVDLEIRQKIQYAQVNGLSDRALADRINQRLKGAATEPLQRFLDQLAFPDDPEPLDPSIPKTRLLTSRATVGLHGPRLVSVSYKFDTDGGEFGRYVSWSSTYLTIDLKDGRELGTRELLAERIGTPDGTRTLEDLLVRNGEGGKLCGTVEGTRPFEPTDFVSDKPAEKVASVWPTKQGLTFRLALWKLGYPMSCNSQEIKIPYAELDGLLGAPLEDQMG